MKKGIASKGSEFESMASLDLAGKAGKLIANPTSQEEIQMRLQMDREIQQEITDYNMDLESANYDKRFQNKQFIGNFIIIKLEKINWLVPSEVDPNIHTINNLHYTQVVTPDFPSGKVVANPLPYNYRGTVVAVGDEVNAHRESKLLSYIFPGDTAELTWFDMKEFRYYPNKQKVDHITLDTPYAPNFEGFVKVPAQFVEAIVPSDMFEEVYGSREELYKVNADKISHNLDYK